MVEKKNKTYPLKRQSRLQPTHIHKYFSIFFSEKIRFDVSSEFSAGQNSLLGRGFT